MNLFKKNKSNNFVIAEIVNPGLRNTTWAKIIFLEIGFPRIQRHGWTSIVYLTPTSAYNLRRKYTTSYTFIKWLIELK